ncbi:hypothetical protein GCM10020220_023580 [Nonomuraea rubra]
MHHRPDPGIPVGSADAERSVLEREARAVMAELIAIALYGLDMRIPVRSNRRRSRPQACRRTTTGSWLLSC